MNRRILLITLISIFILPLYFGASFASAESGIRVHYTEQTLTLDPNDDIWNKAEPYSIKLVAQEVTNPLAGGSVPKKSIRALNKEVNFVLNLSKKAPEVSIKALHNGEKVALQLSWEDKIEDIENAVDTFRDAIAIMFPVNLSSGYNPSPLMGSKGEPVNIWQWRADWQADFDGRRNLGARQPLTQGVWISPVDKILKKEYPGRPSQKATMAEYIAEGFGTLTRQVKQDVSASAKYHNGKWTVVFLRDIKRAEKSDAEFILGKQTFINLAVWNGSESDVNGMKSISLVWTPLIFDSAPTHAKK